MSCVPADVVTETFILYVPEESALNFDHHSKPVTSISVALEPAGFDTNDHVALVISEPSPKFHALT